MKAVRTMVASCVAGLDSPGSERFAGQGPVRQRSIPADLIFGSFYQEKEQSPAAIEQELYRSAL